MRLIDIDREWRAARRRHEARLVVCHLAAVVALLAACLAIAWAVVRAMEAWL
jgi:hypothetical protein